MSKPESAAVSKDILFCVSPDGGIIDITVDQYSKGDKRVKKMFSMSLLCVEILW